MVKRVEVVETRVRADLVQVNQGAIRLAPRDAIRNAKASEAEPHGRRAVPTTANRNPVKLRYFIVVLVCGWAMYHYWSVQHVQLVHLQAQMKVLETQLGQAHTRQAVLTQQVKEFQNTSFIAQYASERFNLIEPKQVSFELTH